MNVSPINASISALSQTSSTKAITKPHPFPREIAIRLRTLNLLAHKVIGVAAPNFCKIISYLDQPKSSISFEKCEKLFEEAFIQEFSNDEIDVFLEHFFKEFDPDEYFISYKDIKTTEGKIFLWENIIRYYCSQYVGFQSESLSLENIFNIFNEKFDPENNIIKVSPSEYKAQLELNFDHAMNIIPKFSSNEIIQMKLLLISYAALLTSALQKVEENTNLNLMFENGFSIQDLFEEILFMLLELPFMPIEMSAAKLIYHEKLDSLNPEALKKKFLSELVNYLVESEDPQYEQNSSAVYEVMKECYLLDFEIKEILQNISANGIKKT